MTDSITPVYAIQIGSITDVEGGFAVITPQPNQKISDRITVTETFVEKFNPQPGGYYIMCEGGIGLYSAE
ncbi:hypothetical protein D5Y64_09915 [Klebsiella pneumoniae]|uniref:hypothetical protein n=1 Tax=Klebsiella pneumoniae TaxID=573 RepID=UPI00178054F7|nr:hypothetical protein [Klebsiella pneumoniae]MBD8355607.1 hypothetical protein [Klebsiella pneumoniae]